MQKEYGFYSTDVKDLTASFHGSWCSHGWIANTGIVSAIAEVSSQIIEISYLCCSCAVLIHWQT